MLGGPSFLDLTRRIVHECRFISIGVGLGAHLLGVRIGRSCGIADQQAAENCWDALWKGGASAPPQSAPPNNFNKMV
jgi:hypothetical protein